MIVAQLVGLGKEKRCDLDVVEQPAPSPATSRRRPDSRLAPELPLAFDAGGTRLAAPQGALVYLFDVNAKGPTNAERLLRTIRGHENSVRDAAFRPDGSRLITVDAQGAVKQWDPAPQEPRLHTPFSSAPALNSCILPSPDRSRVAFVPGASDLDRRFRLADGAGRLVKECESSLSPGHCDHLVIAHDGRTVAFLWHDTLTSFSLFVWDANAGRELLHLDLGVGAYGHIDLAPDGSRVAVTTVAGLEKYGWCNSTVRVFETATGREIFSRRGLRTESTFWPACSPDGRWIALNRGSSADGDSRIVLLDSRTGDEMAALKLGAQKLTSLAVSRDGRFLAATRSEGETKTVLAWEAGQILRGESPDPIVTLTGHGGEVNHYEFSPDGRRVLTSGAGVVKRWDAATGREVLALKAKGHVLRDAFFSPDGHGIWAGLDENGRLWGWDSSSLVTSLTASFPREAACHPPIAGTSKLPRT